MVVMWKVKTPITGIKLGYTTRKEEKVMLKVGDRVERINCSHGGLSVGDVATVREVSSPRNVYLEGHTAGHLPSNLELVEPKVTIDPVTFEHDGKTYEYTGEFREPVDGDAYTYPSGSFGSVSVQGVSALAGKNPQYGKNRIILREVEKRERPLTENDLVSGTTVRCNACDCTDAVGELFSNPIPHGCLWFHRNQVLPIEPGNALAVEINGETIFANGVRGNITVVED